MRNEKADRNIVQEFFFEVQFHTPESIQLKHDFHHHYAKAREPSVTDADRALLQQQMVVRWKALPFPEDVLSLDKAVVRPAWWKQ